MSTPTNLSDRGAGEMSAAAQMHAEPVMRLNKLTRWYLVTAFVLLSAAVVSELAGIFTGSSLATSAGGPFIYGALATFFGGFSIKFLPSSLGGNPHVYSLNMALWSYWLLVGGALTWWGGSGLYRWSETVSDSTLISVSALTLGPLLFLTGLILLTINVWKTIQQRV